MRPLALAFLLSLTGCYFVRMYQRATGPALPPPPADVTCADGARVYFDGIDAGGYDTCGDLVRITAASPAVCPEPQIPAVMRAFDGVQVHWRPDGFDCGRGIRGCHGMQLGPALYVSSPAVIADEGGHIVWELCTADGGTGENNLPDAGVWSHPDYEGWVGPLRAQMR